MRAKICKELRRMAAEIYPDSSLYVTRKGAKWEGQRRAYQQLKRQYRSGSMKK